MAGLIENLLAMKLAEWANWSTILGFIVTIFTLNRIKNQLSLVNRNVNNIELTQDVTLGKGFKEAK